MLEKKTVGNGTSLENVVIENSRFPRNINIPRNIRAKPGGSLEYWGESRNIAGIYISCPLHSQLDVQLGVLDMQTHMQIHRKMTLPGFRRTLYYFLYGDTGLFRGAQCTEWYTTPANTYSGYQEFLELKPRLF